MKYLKKYQKTIIICFLLILSIIIICIGSSYSLYKIETKGQVHNTIVTGNHSTCQYEDGYVWNFDYTGSEQEFTVPCEGIYKLETWGAQGGGNSTYVGGYGGYATGKILLSNNSIVYIDVGQTGEWSTVDYTILPETFNGGGGANQYWSQSTLPEWHSSGGGATHMAKVSGTINAIGYESFVTNNNGYLVAAGGGGAGYFSTDSSNVVKIQGGHGGGFEGVIGNTNSTGMFPNYINISANKPATQTTPSTLYYTTSSSSVGFFGKSNSSYVGGGGGLFGGAGIHGRSSGGSGYIGNTNLTNKVMYCYNCTESNEEANKTISTTCTSATPTENCAKQGNGYARITLVETTSQVLPPKITGGSNEYKITTTISISKEGNAPTGIKEYEYYYTNSSEEPTNETQSLGTGNSITINETGEWNVYFRTVSNSGLKSKWSKVETTKIDATSPELILNNLPASSTKGDSYKIVASYNSTGPSGINVTCKTQNGTIIDNIKNLDKGTYNLTCIAETGAGKTETKTQNITITYSPYSVTNSLYNPSFNNSTSGWTGLNGLTASLSGGAVYIPLPAAAWSTGYGSTQITIPGSNVNHKYYIQVKALAPSTGFGYGFGLEPGGGNVYTAPSIPYNNGEYITTSTMFTATSNNSYFAFYKISTTSSSSTLIVDYAIVVDLTATFGSGNEPTKSWCDNHFGFFEGTQTIYK